VHDAQSIQFRYVPHESFAVLEELQNRKFDSATSAVGEEGTSTLAFDADKKGRSATIDL
ncbi:unnamed protein product, partial [Amoebophrya sp. A120]